MSKPLPDDVYNARWLARVFANSVRTDTGCLIWQGFEGHNGYGQTSYRDSGCRVHRQVLKLTKGVEPGQDACHTCDVRMCVEPSHLWAGTRRDNLVDCLEKKRHHHDQVTHCPRGHAYDGENVKFWNTGKGTGKGRACKACQRGRMRVNAGWPEELAYSLPPTPAGHRPFGKSWKRRSSLGE